MAIGAYEAVTELSLTNPNATWQQKVMVGAGGAVIGGVGAGLSLYVGTSVVATAIVGGVSTGFQQGFTNAVSGKPILNTNILSQAAIGTVTSGLATKAVKTLNLIPNNVGRPIKISNDRKFVDSFKKNSLNTINKNTIPDLIATKLKVITNSLITIFSNNSKNKQQNKKS